METDRSDHPEGRQAPQRLTPQTQSFYSIICFAMSSLYKNQNFWAEQKRPMWQNKADFIKIYARTEKPDSTNFERNIGVDKNEKEE